jgi:lipid-binding SYLF domain-containing protein
MKKISLFLIILVLAGCATTKKAQVCQDPEVRDRARQTISEVARHVDPGVTYYFNVIETEQINAAIYYQKNLILVTRGLMDLYTDNELRFVVAHEMAHRKLNHYGKKVVASEATTTAFRVVNVLVPGAGLLNLLVNPAVTNAFSREFELDADREACQSIISYLNVPLADCASALDKLRDENIEEGKKGLFILFASHPPVNDRIGNLQSLETDTDKLIMSDRKSQKPVTRKAFYLALRQKVPDWQAINKEPGFLQWLEENDASTNKPKKQLIMDAYRAQDADRVSGMFLDYKQVKAAKVAPLNEKESEKPSATSEPTPNSDKPSATSEIKRNSDKTVAMSEPAPNKVIPDNIRPDEKTIKFREIDAQVDEALALFRSSVNNADECIERAKGMLVVPDVSQAGYLFGGAWGDGALRIGGKTAEYYSMKSISYGAQLGAQSKKVIVFFFEENALRKFRDKGHSEVGIDGSVSALTVGSEGTINTSYKEPMAVFTFGQSGLFVNVSLTRTTFDKIEK